jgi:hypothetical protein
MQTNYERDENETVRSDVHLAFSLRFGVFSSQRPNQSSE